MLALTRKEGERIYIGNDIVVTVCRIKGDKVRLLFDAPKDVLVLREELLKRTTRVIPRHNFNGDEPLRY
jgi:carbon storage regulator